MGYKLFRYVLPLLLLGAMGQYSSLTAQSRLDSLEQVARALYGADIDSSRAVARTVLGEAESVEDHGKVAWALNWIGICFLKNGLSDSVRHYLDECVTYSQAHNVEDILGKARLNQSINAHQMGDYERSVTMGLEALAQFEQQDDPLGIAHAYYNTGLSYQRMDRMETARDFYYKALPLYEEHGGILNRANNLNAIGSYWTTQMESDSALKYHEAAVAVKLSVGAWAYCGAEYSNMAAIFEQTGDSAQAEDYYGRSFRAYEAIGDLRGASLVASNLSNFKYFAEDWDSAIYFGEMGLEIADTTSDRFLLSYSHQRLARAYEAMGDFEQAFFHDQLYDSLQLLITGAEVQKNIDELHVQYETEKREKELAKERVVSQRKTFWLIGSGVGLLALLGVFGLWFRSEREKKRRLVAQARIDLESERNRISMDLHDHLGAELTILTSRLDTQAFKAQDPQVGDALEALAQQTREANAQLRETIWSVRSTSVTLDQLALKIREFGERLLAESPLKLQIRTEGEAILGPAVALDLFRVLQEAIHNAHKYSGGSQVELEVVGDGNQLWVSLKDDGKGFAAGEIEAGYGLSNMEERIRNLGGTFHLDSRSGTAISISLPLKA